MDSTVNHIFGEVVNFSHSYMSGLHIHTTSPTTARHSCLPSASRLLLALFFAFTLLNVVDSRSTSPHSRRSVPEHSLYGAVQKLKGRMMQVGVMTGFRLFISLI